MTSIAVWAGVDTHGPASIYIATDSRISWGISHQWDQGRKVFACPSRPHILGYWGDVLFPALCIPVLVDQIEHGILDALDAEDRYTVLDAVRDLWCDYPDEERRDFAIVHVFRTGDGMECSFHLAIMTYERKSDSWDVRSIGMPSSSAELAVAGSGAKAVRRSIGLWQMSGSAGTSRAVFGAFCESVASGRDQRTGGAPQLVGLYRIGGGRLFGFTTGRERFLAGAKLADSAGEGDIEWRNGLFERVDRFGERVPGAQRHSDRERGIQAVRPQP
jgi:hypothetical protein